MAMSHELFVAASNLVRKHEGKRNRLYVDPGRVALIDDRYGVKPEDQPEFLDDAAITVGYGYNLSANGLPDYVIELLLEIKLNEANAHLLKYAWYSALSIRRQAALIDMVYEMGGAKFDEFTDMLAALAWSMWQDAHDAAIDSGWAREVPARAQEDANLILVG